MITKTSCFLTEFSFYITSCLCFSVAVPYSTTRERPQWATVYTTLQSSPTFLLQTQQLDHFQKLGTDDSPAFLFHEVNVRLLRRFGDDSGLCGHFFQAQQRELDRLVPSPVAPVHQTKWFLVKRCDGVRKWSVR